MRHERISTTNVAAAAWPAGIERLVLTAPTPSETPSAEQVFARPETAVPDIAPGVGRLIVGAYAGLLTVLFAFFTGSALALFAVTIAAGFAIAFFTVPILFLRVEADRSRRPSLDGFLYQGMQTLTGHCSGRDALVQMLVVPVLLTFGLAAMGIAGAIFL
jgi:pimeloyl-ACP methyl ester carboxylesterase